MYLLVLRSAQGARSVVPLVVRDAHPGSPLLYTASSLTWQAYNKFGGYSLYHGRRHDVAGRSRVASFNRPYDSGGIRSLMVHDVPLVRYLEQLGHDVDYTDDLDLDQRPSQLLQHRALVIPGHSEYWTTRMYDAVEFARDAGVNVAFLGANQVYWHARLEVGPGAARRRMAVYRDRREDEAGRRDPALTTVTWSSPPLDRPQLSLTGAAFGKYGTVAHYRVVSANSWIFAGTALRDGSVLRQAVAGEWDRVVADPRTPENVEVLAEAPIITHQGQATMATMSYYTAPSGAGVFNAGVTFWPCHLYGTCPGRQTPAATRRALRTITANVLRAFAREPAGRRHPSVPRMPHDPASLVRSARPADVAIMPALSGE